VSDFASVVEDRGRKATRTILEAKERLTPGIPDADADELRAVIVEQVAELYRLAASLLRTLEGQIGQTANVNQLWLEAIGGQLGIELPEPEPVLARNGQARR
jgi:hypothetical protein